MTSNWWASRLAQEGQQQPIAPVPQRLPPPAPQPSPRSPQRLEEACPNCGSTNYLKRCFDCGYPVQQSGSGVGLTKTDGVTHRSVQVPSGSYSPQTIVGRVE